VEPIERSSGATKTERYLARLCERTFLSLWSYPNLYTPEGRHGGSGVGKELCDLLVVFGSDILIFSDKDIRFNTEIDTKIAWNRWRKRAISSSARQLFGAEKWIRENPTQIFLDPECTKSFPLTPQMENARFHLIAVTKNTSEAAQRFFGGGSSGSLMLIPLLSDEQISERPFVVNDLDQTKTFVHVLDELTLDIVFGELDTTYDLVRYLRAKEDAIRSRRVISATGEEDLLAAYLLLDGLTSDTPFDIQAEPGQAHALTLMEGFWQEYFASPQRQAMRDANSVAYFWDALIEHFAVHIRTANVGVGADKSTATHEQAIRLLAAEGRLSRRYLAAQFLQKMAEVPPDRRSARVCPSPFNNEVCFIFVFYPRDIDEDYESYRQERMEHLQAYAIVASYRFPQYRWITLIGTEPITTAGRSEDVLAVENHPLSADEKQMAQKIMVEDNILNDVRNLHHTEIFAPNRSMESNPKKHRPKVGRNHPCPCGSGKKWKKCCGAYRSNL
jgi:SEC-C motif